MPSMSYCAFENTCSELSQLKAMVGYAIDDNEPLDLNEYEKPYFDRISDEMAELIELIEQYQTQFQVAE